MFQQKSGTQLQTGFEPGQNKQIGGFLYLFEKKPRGQGRPPTRWVDIRRVGEKLCYRKAQNREERRSLGGCKLTSEVEGVRGLRFREHESFDILKSIDFKDRKRFISL